MATLQTIIKLIKGAAAGPRIVSANKLACSMGLISSYGKLKVLRMNGVRIGGYYFTEDVKKELLEREFGITNYAILSLLNSINASFKNNINSDSARVPMAFMFVEDDNDPLYGKALFQYKLLWEYLIKGDLAAVKKMFDIDYLSRFLALTTLFDDAGCTPNKDMKLVYDFTRAKFYPIFNAVVHNADDQSGPTSNIPNSDKTHYSIKGVGYEPSINIRIFNFLLKDKTLNSKVASELQLLSSFQDSLNSEVKQVSSNNRRVLSHSRDFDRTGSESENHLMGNSQQTDSGIMGFTDSQVYICIDSLAGKVYLARDPSVQVETISGEQLFERADTPYDTVTSDDMVSFQTFEWPTGIRSANDLIVIDGRSGNALARKSVHVNYIDSSVEPSLLPTEQMLRRNGIRHSFYSDSLVIRTGDYRIRSNISINAKYRTHIEMGTKFRIDSKVNVCIHGSVTMAGTQNDPIEITGFDEMTPYGNFSIIGSGAGSHCNMNFVSVSGGSTAFYEGMLFTGQFSIYSSDVVIRNSTFTKSQGDDGLNIKYSKVLIDSCSFMKNMANQVDLDFCMATISNSDFSPSSIDPNGDGLDLSGTYSFVSNCIFTGFSDKGLSLGEKSKVLVTSCSFNENYNAIAVKDQTKLISWNNMFNNNHRDYFTFIKKDIFRTPELFLTEHRENYRIAYKEGEIVIVPMRTTSKELDIYINAFDRFNVSGQLTDKMTLGHLID